MRNALLITAAAIAILAAPMHGDTIWDFTYSYDNVFSTNADDHVHSVVDAAKVSESGVTSYYQPSVGNPGEIVYKFEFDDVTESGHLLATISTFHWTYGQGEGWIHASKDGANWVELVHVTAPAYGQANYGGFNSFLPLGVLGADELWVKATISTTNTSGVRNTAQHSRGYADGNPSFELKADIAPEPGTLVLLTAGGLAILKRRKRRA